MIRRTLIGGALALAGSPAGAATFLDTIACEASAQVVGGAGVICSPPTATINPAVRFSEEFFIVEEGTFAGFFSVDFEPTATGAILNLRATSNVNVFGLDLLFTNLSDYWATANLLGVRGLGPLGTVAGADGFTAGDVTLRNGQLTLDLAGTRANRNDLARIELIEGPRPIDAIPEPLTWTMMIAGFGLTGASARRKRLVTA
jgi:hypothetical protein